jgi:hypothetical protein
MMSENSFFLRMWGVAAMILIAMIASCTYSGHDKRDKWEKAVSNGADPMVASCALFVQETIEQAACLIMAQNRK